MSRRRPLRLLALDLSARGFGYAVLDSKLGLLDYGCSSFVASNDHMLIARVTALIGRHGPTALVLENFACSKAKETATRRSALLIQLAAMNHIGLVQVSRVIVQRVLGEPTKATRARLIAMRFSELNRLLPRARAPWQAEHKRMSIFDAAGLGIAALGGV